MNHIDELLSYHYYPQVSRKTIQATLDDNAIGGGDDVEDEEEDDDEGDDYNDDDDEDEDDDDDQGEWWNSLYATYIEKLFQKVLGPCHTYEKV